VQAGRIFETSSSEHGVQDQEKGKRVGSWREKVKERGRERKK
jgi:hypothetical protein